MTWIKLESTLAHHPKMDVLMKLTGLERLGAIGSLVLLWWWSADNSTEGILPKLKNWEIASICKFRGNEDTFVSALIEAGFLDKADGVGLKIHDWDQWISDPVRLKKRRTSDKCPTNVGVAQESLSSVVVVLSFPVSGKTKTWPLPEVKLQEWIDTYPGLDVLSECKKSLQWIKDNPTRQKTFNGMPRFLNSWLSRAQNSYRGNTPTSKNPVTLTADEMRVINGWKYVNSIPINGPESDAWNSVHAQRCAPAARSLLTLFGPWDAAVDAMEYIYMNLKSKHLSCTMDTIVKHSDLYREYKAGRIPV